MGLTTWENAPSGKIVKTDVSIAKNYLKESELDDMGHLVNALLDLATSPPTPDYEGNFVHSMKKQAAVSALKIEKRVTAQSPSLHNVLIRNYLPARRW